MDPSFYGYGFGGYQDKPFRTFCEEGTRNAQFQEVDVNEGAKSSSLKPSDYMVMMSDWMKEKNKSRELQEENDLLRSQLEELQKEQLRDKENPCKCEAATLQLGSQLYQMQETIDLLMEKISSMENHSLKKEELDLAHKHKEKRSPFEKEVLKHFEKESAMWNKHLKAQEKIHQKCIDHGNKLSQLESSLESKLSKMASLERLMDQRVENLEEMVKSACIHKPDKESVQENPSQNGDKIGVIQVEAKNQDKIHVPHECHSWPKIDEFEDGRISEAVVHRPNGNFLVDLEDFWDESKEAYNEEILWSDKGCSTTVGIDVFIGQNFTRCGRLDKVKEPSPLDDNKGASVVDLEEFLNELEATCEEETKEAPRTLNMDVAKDDEVTRCISMVIQESSQISEVEDSTTPMEEQKSQKSKMDVRKEHKLLKKRKRKEKKEKAKIETKGLKERVKVLEEMVFRILNGETNVKVPSSSDEGEKKPQNQEKKRVYDPP